MWAGETWGGSFPYNNLIEDQMYNFSLLLSVAKLKFLVIRYIFAHEKHYFSENYLNSLFITNNMYGKKAFYDLKKFYQIASDRF